ncbi:20021_t:CDS:2, partial [Funneliformis geosporum]
MAPKSTGKNIEAETVLQAVVLADSFNERFQPITFDMPRSLVYKKYIYFIESIHEKVKNYVKTSKWNRSYSPFKIITIVTPEARSV